MWLYIISAIVVVLLSPILLGIVDYIRSIFRLKFYERQGLYTIYSIKGIFSIAGKDWPENKKVSNMEKLKALANQHRHRKAIATKRIDSHGAYVMFLTEEFAKDFIMQEDNFDRLSLYSHVAKDIFGFFFWNGQKYHSARSVFVSAFSYERLSNFTMSVARMIEKEMNNFAAEKNIGKDEYTRINFKDLMNRILEKVLNIFTFGVEDVDPLPSGESVYHAVHSVHATLVTLRNYPLFLLIPGICTKYKLIQPIKDLERIENELTQYLAKVYKQRENSNKLGDCAMDMIVLHNRKCKETGNMEEYMDDKQLFGAINLFQFAGTDTSLNLVTNMVCAMAQRTELQQKFAEFNKQIFDEKGNIVKESIETNPSLDEWIKEGLRLCNPTSRLSQRIAKKDCVINGIKIQAGDAVTLSFLSLHFNEEFFKQPSVFDKERFNNVNEKKIPRYQYVPFGLGKRICLGRNLGQLISKMNLSLFCRAFEFRKPEDVEYYTHTITISSQETPILEVRRRS